MDTATVAPEMLTQSTNIVHQVPTNPTWRQHHPKHSVDKEEVATEGEHAEEAGNEVATAPTRMTFRNIMAICALSGLLAGSQIPVYLVGGGIANVYKDIGGENSYAWLSIANTLALAAIAPFAGSFADLVGRRWVAMIGGVLIIVGCAVLGTAHTMAVAIGGMAIAGAGAGLGELTATAAVVELVPVQKRGYYVSIVSMLVLMKQKTKFRDVSVHPSILPVGDVCAALWRI